jgi:hypothetical protein
MSILKSSPRPIKIIVSSETADPKIERVLKSTRKYQAHPVSVDEQPPQDIHRFICSTVRNWTGAQFLASEDDEIIVARVKEAVIETVTRKAGRM